MVVVLDANAVLALLRDEPAAAPVQRLIEEDEPAVVTLTAVAEVVDVLVRTHGLSENEALSALSAPLTEVAPLSERLAVAAGLLRAHHYHRTRRNISMADCVAAETARDLGARLATSDPHLLDMCAEEGIEVVPLPDSSGAMWQRPT